MFVINYYFTEHLLCSLSQMLLFLCINIRWIAKTTLLNQLTALLAAQTVKQVSPGLHGCWEEKWGRKRPLLLWWAVWALPPRPASEFPWSDGLFWPGALASEPVSLTYVNAMIGLRLGFLSDHHVKRAMRCLLFHPFEELPFTALTLGPFFPECASAPLILWLKPKHFCW